MKNFFVLAIMALVVFSSCQKEEVKNTQSTTPLTMEEIQNKITSGTLPEVEIEHATLEEINALFIENGLEPIQENISNRSNWCAEPGHELNWCQCTQTVIYYLGDLNQNGTLTGADVVLMTKHLLDIQPLSSSLARQVGGISGVSNNCNGIIWDGPDFTDRDLMVSKILGCC